MFFQSSTAPVSSLHFEKSTNIEKKMSKNNGHLCLGITKV